MVYCTRCGAENEEGATKCVSCGEPLGAPVGKRDWEEELEVRAEQFGRRMEAECFGLPGGSSIFGILFGLAIVLFGLSIMFDWNLNLGPIVAIVFGLLMVAGALYGQGRR